MMPNWGEVSDAMVSVLTNVYVNDLNKNIKEMLIKFLYEVVKEQNQLTHHTEI